MHTAGNALAGRSAQRPCANEDDRAHVLGCVVIGDIDIDLGIVDLHSPIVSTNEKPAGGDPASFLLDVLL